MSVLRTGTPSQKALRVTFLILYGLLISNSFANVQDRSCEMAMDMASSAYSQAAEAVKEKQYFKAFERKNEFWNVERYSRGCKGMQALAKALIESKLGPDDEYAGPYTDEVPSGPYGSSGGGTTGSGTGTSGASGTSGTTGTSGGTGTSGASGTGGSPSAGSPPTNR